MTPELSDRHLIEPKDPLSQTFLFWESDLLDVEHMMFLLIYNGPFTFGTFLSTYFKKKQCLLGTVLHLAGCMHKFMVKFCQAEKKVISPEKKNEHGTYRSIFV